MSHASTYTTDEYVVASSSSSSSDSAYSHEDIGHKSTLANVQTIGGLRLVASYNLGYSKRLGAKLPQRAKADCMRLTYKAIFDAARMSMI